MPRFRYTARDERGVPRSGEQEAADADALAAELRARGWLVSGIKAAGGGGGIRRGALISPLRYLPAKEFDIEVGLRQLAAMSQSGLTLLAGLRTVAEQARREPAARIWRDLAGFIEAGGTLSGGMERHKRHFSNYVQQLVRVGESSGELPGLLRQAAEHLESSRNLRLMLLNAMAYPALVVVMAVGVSAFLLLGVIPKIQRFLISSGKALPPLTQALLDVSEWFALHLPGIGIFLAVAAAVLFAMSRWSPGRYWLHYLMLYSPVAGPVTRVAETSVFARGMSILLESGVTLLDSLQTVEGLIRNDVVSRRVGETREAVTRGETLAAALGAGREFLPMLPRMVAVGESTGMLGQTLDDVAGFHESQLVAIIRKLGLVIEPVMIIVVGGIVGFVYVAFFMALFSMASNV